MEKADTFLQIKEVIMADGLSVVEEYNLEEKLKKLEE